MGNRLAVEYDNMREPKERISEHRMMDHAKRMERKSLMEYEHELRKQSSGTENVSETFGGEMQPTDGGKGREGRYKKLEKAQYD